MIHTTGQSYHIRAIPLLILVFLMGTSALAQTPISGNLSGSLTLSDSPYLVTASSNVIAGETVAIDANELEPDHTSWWRIIARDGNFNQTTADPGLRAIVRGNDLSPVPDTNQFAFSVGNIWPNPSSLNSSLSFSLPKSQDIRLQVFDVRGRLIQTLVDDSFDAGVHVVRWNGRDRSGNRAANGLYFYRLQTDNGDRVRRLVMVR